ncbi:uncharacterized protein K452DRAFT_315937 [Aplosporella prunicola CBS 121167]|uniref:Uncharacterized protein n=1 Tax=Aplosporella prunicola CBS 121167 TaxID=1176127 RepID=A0A6A6BNX3_9PEZI|nr:uncharacterized protein K452DRAFT_315937 [Aplosporella prunicola CBS 121167]KAF2145766.1 hypothetical protein K452DRAFT_315937 [Aplosporella prunicola CBS 121167]
MPPPGPPPLPTLSATASPPSAAHCKATAGSWVAARPPPTATTTREVPPPGPPRSAPQPIRQRRQNPSARPAAQLSRRPATPSVELGTPTRWPTRGPGIEARCRSQSSLLGGSAYLYTILVESHALSALTTLV